MMLLDRIDVAAHENWDRPAISCPVSGNVTFGEVLAASERVRHNLARCKITPGERIAIFAHRSAAVVIAMHAVISAGCSYIPIYHGSPLNRLKVILADCDPSAVICDPRSAAAAKQAIDEIPTDISLILVDPNSIGGSEPEASGKIADVTLTGDSEFSIMYTSGSTGAPKGVMLTHGNLSHYIDWATSYFEVDRHDVVFSTAPFHFDMSSFDIYVALSTGAKLVIASEKECLFPKVLLKRLRSEAATVWKAVAPLLSNIARSVDLSAVEMPALRSLVFSGDRMPVRDLRTWMSAFPEVSYFNGYGPTEATGVSCCFRVPALNVDNSIVPIGKGRIGGEIAIFDNDERVDGPDRRGEIVISGPGIAKGYWRDDAKTAGSFFTRIGAHELSPRVYKTGDIGYWDSDGNVVFIGRADRQVKHQGYRIELDEIEVALGEMQGVIEVAVVQIPEGPHQGLAAFFESNGDIDEAAARVYLASRIPAYMVPRLISRIGSLPRGDRGKVDYIALAQDQ